METPTYRGMRLEGCRSAALKGRRQPLPLKDSSSCGAPWPRFSSLGLPVGLSCSGQVHRLEQLVQGSGVRGVMDTALISFHSCYCCCACCGGCVGLSSGTASMNAHSFGGLGAPGAHTVLLLAPYCASYTAPPSLNAATTRRGGPIAHGVRMERG